MKFLRGLFFVILVILLIHPRIFADVNQTIEELQKKISELHSQEDTLSKQIKLLDSQIALTNAKIVNISQAINKLTNEIDELAGEIERLEALLTRRSELVIARIPQSYKRKVIPHFGLIFFSANFSDFLAKAKYLANIQSQDVQLLFQLKLTQNHYGDRKNLREEKKQEQQNLQAQLRKENDQLVIQKKQKQALLVQTQNSETVYQRLLAQALAEKQALDKALTDAVKIGPVKKGDPIALVGNSGYPGCSTGAHLHFEVRQGGSWVDPGIYLSRKNVQDEQNGGSISLGEGSWDWPLSDTIRLTQRFGKTPWSWRYAYSGGIHTGYDMVSTNSIVIRAPADGVLYSSSQTCGGSSIIKIKYIDQGNNLMSFYLHVQ